MCFAAITITSLAIIAVVAVVAFLAESRLVFMSGSLGSWAGWIIPKFDRDGTMMFACAGDYSIFYYESWVAHVLLWGVLGAGLGCLLSWEWWESEREKLMERDMVDEQGNSERKSL